MNKDLLQHIFNNTGTCDQGELIDGMLHTNAEAVKNLIAHMGKGSSLIVDPPKGEKSDLDTLKWYARRQVILKAIRQELDGYNYDLTKFSGNEHLKELRDSYLRSTESEDLGEVRKKLLVLNAKLAELCVDGAENASYRADHDVRVAKIKALINLLDD